MAIEGSLAAEERQEILLRTLRHEGRVGIDDAAEELGVHPMTIRRALKILERDGRARLVRGGAVYVGTEEFAVRQSRSLRAKKAIAAKVAPLLRGHDAIGFDASSTVHVLAQNMPPAEHLLIVTAGLQTFHALQTRQDIRSVLSGGELDPRTGSLVGPTAQQTIERFVLSCCVISANAVDPETGTMEATPEEAAMKFSLVQSSEQVVLALDATKLDQRSAVRSIPLHRIDVLVTELDPEDARLDPFRDLVEIL